MPPTLAKEPVVKSPTIGTGEPRFDRVAGSGEGRTLGRGPGPAPLVRLALAAASLLLAACGRSQPRVPVTPAQSAEPRQEVAGDAPLRLRLTPEQVSQALIDHYVDRIMAHRYLPDEVERVASTVAPVVAAAAAEPDSVALLRTISESTGQSLDAVTASWVRAQEADLFLESAGDPDALSVSKAAGVAQWMVGTARGAGLHVDAARSAALTNRIAGLQRRAAWDSYLARPGAQLSVDGAPTLSPAQAAEDLSICQATIPGLIQQRRQADDRYVPERAIRAQTRYLLKLYHQFPSLDWLYEAYHGGVGGARRLLRLYTGNRWPNSTAAAVRTGAPGGLTYARLYEGTSPRSHSPAFQYLYGRGDDHRHYWWKLLASEQVLAAYLRDPAAFRESWLNHLPGRPPDARYYPDALSLALPDLAALKSATADGRLVRVSGSKMLLIRPARCSVGNAADYSVLSPDAKGALQLLIAATRRAGAAGPLVAGDLTSTASCDRAVAARATPRAPHMFPPEPDPIGLPPSPPRDFNYHTTGRVFDLLRPGDLRSRELLEYAIGYLEDRDVLTMTPAKDGGTLRYHIAPNPAHRDALASLANGAQLKLAGL